MVDLNQIRAQLAQVDHGGHSGAVDPAFIEKIAAAAAQQGALNALASLQHQQQYSMQKMSQVEQAASALDEMCWAHTAGVLKASGVDVDEFFGVDGLYDATDDLVAAAADLRDKISEELAEAEELDEELAEEALEEAMGDPEVAAALISEATGEDIDPEDIEALALELAEGMSLDDEGYEKEAHVKLSSAVGVLEKLSSPAQFVIGLRARGILEGY